MANVTLVARGVATNAVQPVNANVGETLDYRTRQSPLGTPSYSWIIFQPDPYESDEGETIEPPSLELHTILLKSKNLKHIVQTKVQGRPGTVKELVSTGDYEITLNGKFVDRQDFRIKDQKDIFRQVFEVPERIRVECPFLEDLNVSDVVIKRWDMNEIRGSKDMLGLSVTMLSDRPIELEI